MRSPSQTDSFSWIPIWCVWGAGAEMKNEAVAEPKVMQVVASKDRVRVRFAWG
jgi:hypothetical protein